jgi:hypothetical protein
VSSSFPGLNQSIWEKDELGGYSMGLNCTKENGCEYQVYVLSWSPR